MIKKFFTELLLVVEAILTEGAIIERLRRNPSPALNPYVYHAGFVYGQSEREHLEKLYRQYIDAGFSSGLPILICTPTWRAGKERIEKTGYPDVNRDAFIFMDNIRRTYGNMLTKFISADSSAQKGMPIIRKKHFQKKKPQNITAFRYRHLRRPVLIF